MAAVLFQGRLVAVISQEEKDLISETMGDVVPVHLFDDYLKAAEVKAKRDILAKLLECFTSYCEDTGIRYFMMESSLQGVVAYQDYVPGSDRIEIGMLRADADRLLRLSDSQGRHNAASNSDKLDWEIAFYQDHSSVRRRFPVVKANGIFPVEDENGLVYGRSSMPMYIKDPSFEISIFSAVPDDFLTKRGFFRGINRRNRLLEKVSKARKTIHKNKASIIGANALYAVLPKRVIVDSLFRKMARYENRQMASVARLTGKRSKTVDLQAVDNPVTASFHGVKVYIPNGVTPWASQPVFEPSPELRQLQNCALEIVDEIHRVCEKLGIGYFACGGTMLGYVRDNGFIPWDDDIDVGMLRSDYERFKNEAPSVLNSDQFFLQTRESDPNIPYLFSKIRKNGTSYITEYNKYRDFHKGICVDIFPFDDIPDNYEEQIAFRDKVRAVEVKHNYLVNHQHPKALLAKSASCHSFDYYVSRIVGVALAKKAWSTPLSTTQHEYDQIVQCYNARPEKTREGYVASFVPSYTMVKKQDLLPYRTVDFQGHAINIPAKPERFLRMQYGDYSELPPIHKRTGHDLIDFGQITGLENNGLDAGR